MPGTKIETLANEERVQNHVRDGEVDDEAQDVDD